MLTTVFREKGCEYDYVLHVMGALQRFAARQGDAEALVVSVQRFGGVRKVVRYLTAEYLKDVEDKALSGAVAQIVKTRPEVPFAGIPAEVPGSGIPCRYALMPPTIPTVLQPVWQGVRS
ncbi:MAG: hypothetical protein JXA33_24200 [Anaerolineae bacterium]|nr:hypothetical protein [Anaerolineae bacterium]